MIQEGSLFSFIRPAAEVPGGVPPPSAEAQRADASRMAALEERIRKLESRTGPAGDGGQRTEPAAHVRERLEKMEAGISKCQERLSAMERTSSAAAEEQLLREENSARELAAALDAQGAGLSARLDAEMARYSETMVITAEASAKCEAALSELKAQLDGLAFDAARIKSDFYVMSEKVLKEMHAHLETLSLKTRDSLVADVAAERSEIVAAVNSAANGLESVRRTANAAVAGQEKLNDLIFLVEQKIGVLERKYARYLDAYAEERSAHQETRSN